MKYLKQRFFDRKQLKGKERFKNREAAIAIIEVIARKGHKDKEAFITALSEIPFLDNELTENDIDNIYSEFNKTSSGVLTPEDISKINQSEFISNVERKLREQAKLKAEEDIQDEKKQLDELRQALDFERSELDKFRSELDSIPADIPLESLSNMVEAPKATNTENSNVTWYEEIGLIGDPFPSNQGLIGIPVSKYNDIVVQTPFVKNYLDMVSKTPMAIMDKTIIINGEYGSGKTTLFELLSVSVAESRILPLNVILNPQPSVFSLMDGMYEQMIAILAENHLQRFGYDPRRELPFSDKLVFMSDLMKGLQGGDTTSGFLIMIDGLHKGSTYTHQALEFLQQIQNVQEYFGKRRIKIGFLIAGSQLWSTELERTPSLSGSFYKIETIPPLVEDYALAAVEKRITSFVKDSAKAPKIRRESLRSAFLVLSQRLLHPMTFRDFLDHIRERLEARDFEELGFSISIAVHVEVVKAVRTLLLTSPISKEFQQLWQELRENDALRQACRRVILSILASRGLSERDNIIQNNKGALFLLKKHNLVVQIRHRGQEMFKWHASRQLVETVYKINEKLRITPEQILQAAFEEWSEAVSEEFGKIYGGPVSTLNNMIPTLKDSWPEVAELLVDCRTFLGRIDKTLTEGLRDIPSPDCLALSTKRLIEALNIVTFGKGPVSKDCWESFENSWIAPENTEVILKFGKWSSLLPSKDTSLFGLLHEHSQIVAQLLNTLQEMVRGENTMRLSGKILSFEELRRLHHLRVMFASMKYREVLDGVTDILENAIRENVFYVLRAVWGEKSIERLPSDVRSNISRVPNRGHPRARRGNDDNFLYDISRSEYSKVIFETGVYRAVFGNLLNSQSKSDFKERLELAFSLSDRERHRDKVSYFREHSSEIGDVLRSTTFILDIFQRMCDRVIISGTFEYERQGEEAILGRFFPDENLSPPPEVLRVSGKEALDFGRYLLETLLARDIVVKRLGSVCGNNNLTSEKQLTVLRAFLKRGLIRVNQSISFPLSLSITEEGKRQVKR